MIETYTFEVYQVNRVYDLMVSMMDDFGRAPVGQRGTGASPESGAQRSTLHSTQSTYVLSGRSRWNRLERILAILRRAAIEANAITPVAAISRTRPGVDYRG